LQHAAGELFDGRLRALVRHGFDEGEAAWPPSFAVERYAHAPQFDTVACERLTQFLLGHGVREVADEKSSTHSVSVFSEELLYLRVETSAVVTPDGC
jgi:hypothetical protein